MAIFSRSDGLERRSKVVIMSPDVVHSTLWAFARAIGFIAM